MGKSKKSKKSVVSEVEVKDEGQKDPYAAGKPIKNPEPSNGYTGRPAEVESVPGVSGVAQPHQTPNADAEEQDEVAAGRVEPGSEL